MRKKGQKAEDDFLDLAWRIAFDSATFKVEGTGSEDIDLMQEAHSRLQNIDRSEWFPIARVMYRAGESYDHHRLAERASTRFINAAMGTTLLRVTLGGDY